MPAEKKARIRAEILKVRNAIPEHERIKKSEQITRHFFGSSLFTAAQAIMLYVAIGSEVDPAEIGDVAFARHKRIYVPDYSGLLEVSTSGVRRGDPAAPDVIVMPGVAFDMKGNRLGYGKGWYDRFAKRLRPNAIHVGLAFDAQVVDELPLQEHDIPIDVLITESGLYDFRK